MSIPFDDRYTLEEEAWLWRLVDRYLGDPDIAKYLQNAMFDRSFLIVKNSIITRGVIQDTMIKHHLNYPDFPKGLGFICSLYTREPFYKDDGKTWDENTGEDQLWSYNCQDAVITFEVDAVEQKNIDAMNLRAVHDFQQQLFWPVLRSMNKGLRVDTARRSALALELMEEIASREMWLQEVIGGEFNIRSSVQMQDFFYTQLQLKPIKDRKTGAVTCNDEALSRLGEREPMLLPIIRKIQELRSLGVFLSTFINAPLDTDGRMRCSFNIAGTETYRFSSSKNAFGSGMNLQNIPNGSGTGGLELPNVRKLFIPDHDKTFFDIDLGSADLRIVAWESGEEELKAMLRAGLDPYTEIAKEFYHDPTINKKDPRRQTFKSFAHGTNYLGSAKGLAERLGLSVRDSENTQRWYFERFPRIKRWQDDLKDQVLKRKMVQNVFGYRQYFFDRIEGTIFNQAAAWIPQSTVACLINRAYVAIDEQLPEVDILLQVHDSLAGQYPTFGGETTIKRIVNLAEIPLPYADPLVIPVGIKTSTKSWGDCS